MFASKWKPTKTMNDILTYKDYYATVHYSAEDEIFFGKIAGVSDLVNFEGESVKELQVAFRESVDDYLQTCASVGKTPDKAYKGSFNVRISSELHKEAAYFSAANNLSLNDFIKKTVQYALENKNNFQGILQKS